MLGRGSNAHLTGAFLSSSGWVVATSPAQRDHFTIRFAHHQPQPLFNESDDRRAHGQFKLWSTGAPQSGSGMVAVQNIQFSRIFVGHVSLPSTASYDFMVVLWMSQSAGCACPVTDGSDTDL
ncbi:hypothetical protein JAAARDRAFT_433488 [Jaapia argillacea MUCL 33604]|uniref:Uncharacterized protein n=1 Tax=Jaapia argillacea MUCL 33604 TaxID=933084 RepID=A0A067PPX9_9AGAM|nr:hypothetical protein JAAARDRAFT_433488 [Jaapia argillacea MUCL 33604]